MDDISPPRLIKKGAEASLFLGRWHGRSVMLKKRLPKKYRLSQLDDQIRTFRTIHEPRLMHTARTAGVPTPTVFLVDVSSATIIMEFVRGKLVKELFSQVSESKRRSMCLDIGRLIGRLHLNGIVHGDLTTSNMIVNADEKIYFVDFGLGEKTEELEAKGVDLHLMKRALQSTHFVFAEECFAAVVEGYSRIMGAREAKKVLDNVGEIERRGRYVLERKGVKDD